MGRLTLHVLAGPFLSQRGEGGLLIKAEVKMKPVGEEAYKLWKQGMDQTAEEAIYTMCFSCQGLRGKEKRCFSERCQFYQFYEIEFKRLNGEDSDDADAGQGA